MKHSWLAFLILFLITSFALLIVNSKQKFDLRGKAAPTTVSGNLIIYLTKDASGAVIVESVTAVAGGTRTTPPKSSIPKTHRLEELVNGTVKSNVTFFFHEELLGLPPLPGSLKTAGDPPQKLSKPFAVVEMPYSANSLYRLIDIKTTTIQSVPILMVSKAITEAKPVSTFNIKGVIGPTSNNGGELNNTLDIVFVASGYSDFNRFAADVAAMSNFLLTISPYREYRNAITVARIDNTRDLGCHHVTRIIICDERTVYEVASHVPHDTIVVVHNSDTYGGAAYSGGFAVTYRNVSEWAKEVVVHEMGHSLGELHDEYDYGHPWGGGKPRANCDWASCGKWINSVESSGCFPVCGHNNLYRSTENGSLMRSLIPDGGFKFDTVVKNAMAKQIAKYTTMPTITLPSSTPPKATPTPCHSYTFNEKWGSSGTGNGQFNQPAGIDLDSNGNVYVVDKLNHRIQKFDSTGTFLKKWGSLGNSNGKFNSPSDITLDGGNNSIFVADSGNHRIQKFNINGVFDLTFGIYGASDGLFNSPAGISSPSERVIYISDTLNHRIQRYQTNGSRIQQWGSLGSDNDKFNTPMGLVNNRNKYLYIADKVNNRIQKFDEGTTFIKNWGSFGTSNGQFKSPTDVDADSYGYIYVVDQNNYRVQKFDGQGNFIAKFGSFGSGKGQFIFPQYLAVNSSGKDVYVADTGNHRIEKFSCGIVPL